MTLLDTLKSLLGLETTDGPRESKGEVGVTVEREPSPEADASTEEAVKGVETEASEEPDTGDEAEPEGSGAADSEGVDEDASGADEIEEIEKVEETTEPDEEPAEAEDAEASDASEMAEADDEDLGTDEPTDVLEGIGSAYAERLSGAGVETVADLAAADAAELSEEADIGEGRLETWIERARNR